LTGRSTSERDVVRVFSRMKLVATTVLGEVEGALG
jgi:hypothetical protein